MFQSTIVKKYISTLKEDELISKWETFKSYFHDSGNQNRIRELKEEQFQEGFLKELFVGIFGYIITPNENYNLIPELKNPKDNRKVDGALVFDQVVKCVIELKGTNTTDLGKVETQAFSYKNNQPGCEYVVTSNFEKLRFYIGDATAFLEFNLFELSQDEFNLMYLCLNSTNIENNLPKKIKSESLSQEELITKVFYKDYSSFKRELFNNLIELNREFDKLTLFKKSQKLLDRLLFLFFGEDKFLLPPNSVRLILDDWKDLKERDVEIPLYDRFKKYFGYLNTGFKGKRYDVFPYNGGLFKPDDVLDNILIDDNLFYNNTKKLSEYDFESEVDVNILGYIFENSLNEIEEISNELKSGELDKSNSKRKKDGVFYTPRYITKYIVDNTIGKLCEEKKHELKINEEDYITDKKRIKKTIKGFSDKLNEYRNWLLELTICDPSCGSGAFLNQSLDFLIKEHRYVDELQSKLFGDSLVLSDIENSILENNLFGVDINEESVEITKLSLWLRTAQPNRKLNSLSSNIKCGNSLIDEPIEGVENYFKWEEEFPKVFEKGGFDVIIGNPPWGAKVPKNEKSYIKERFSCKKGELETYVHFIDLCINSILKKHGLVGLITPNTWYFLDKYYELRNFIIRKEIVELIELEKRIFEDAPDIIPAIFILRNNIPKNDKLVKTYTLNKGNLPTFLIDSSIMSSYNIDINNWKKFENLTFNLKLNNSYTELLLKLSNNTTELKDIYKVRYGIKTGNNSKYVKKQEDIDSKNGNWKYCISSASSVKRYSLIWENNMINYGKHLSGYSDNSFEKKKLLIQYIRKLSMERRLISSIDDKGGFYPLNNFSFVEEIDSNNSLDYLQCIVNSNLMNFYFKNVFIDYNIKPKYIEKLPIKNISQIEKLPFVEKSKLMVSLNINLQEVSKKFQRTIQRKFEIDKLPKKLQEWYLLTYGEFIKELGKKKIKLSLSEESEWEDFFVSESKKVIEIEESIKKTDKEIDAMVYQLYNLSREEIEIIESSI